MRRSLVLFFLVTVLIGAVQAQWSINPNLNNPISTAIGDQANAQVVSDGSGGAIITWQDFRGGTSYDIYAQRINASGMVQWTPNGVAISTASNNQLYPKIVTDGSGGAIITWEDYRPGTNSDIYAQRINASGTVLWTADGVAISAVSENQYAPAIISDALGGAIITWADYRNGIDHDIYAQRVNAGGTVQWTAGGVAISSQGGDQGWLKIVSDGSGGAIITWQDYRSGTNYDIYAQRINAGGTVQWAANGVAISTQGGNQRYPNIVSDGSGGAIIAWYEDDVLGHFYASRVNPNGIPLWGANGVRIVTGNPVIAAVPTSIMSDGLGGAILTWSDLRNSVHYDIYAQRINPGGSEMWPLGGVAVSTASGSQLYPTSVSDGSGGAIITWGDNRAANSDIYAQWVDASGTTHWTGNGVAISTASGSQAFPEIVSDGSGGAIIAWGDNRNVLNYDVYAQKVDYNGYLGNVAPQITGVRDVINDQGGRVNVFWNRSYLDVRPTNEIINYQAWRGASGPGAAANALVVSRNEFMQKLEKGESVENIRWASNPEMTSPSAIYWEFYGNALPHQLANYYVPMNTLADSAIQGIYRTFAMVTAVSVQGLYWDSAPDSGYSVDNLPPGAPTGPMASILSSTSAKTHWNPNITDPDVGNYKVYRSTTQNFVIGTSNFVGTANDTIFTDAGLTAGTMYWYRVTTADVHGNESTPTASFTPDKIKASVRAFLAGPFNTGTGLMNTTLNTGGYLAAHFPVGTVIPSDAVDSVNIEMRNNASAAAATVRQFRPAWLMNDGTIRAFLDTTKSYVEFDTLNGNYYLVVLHRNHIPIMTAATQAINYSAPASAYNFTTAQAQAYGTTPMVGLGSVFALVPGDANTNGQVANSDVNAIRSSLGQSGYRNGDINLNGQVANSDVVLTRTYLGRGTQVPSAPLPLPISEKEE